MAFCLIRWLNRNGTDHIGNVELECLGRLGTAHRESEPARIDLYRDYRYHNISPFYHYYYGAFLRSSDVYKIVLFAGSEPHNYSILMILEMALNISIVSKLLRPS